MNYIEDQNLSFKAKGILSYALSEETPNIFNKKELIESSIDGRDSVTNGLNELIEKGYAKSEESRNLKGQYLGIDYFFYSKKQGE